MRQLSSIIAMTFLAAFLSGCSERTDGEATTSLGTAAPGSSTASVATSNAAPPGPVDNACDLLTDAEVRQAFPTAESGKRNTESLQYGLDRCAWKTADGQIGVEVSKVEAAAFEEELRAELQGAVDPRVNGALQRIQFHTVDGIGDHAITVLEKADVHNGLYADISLLAIQRDHRMAVLMLKEGSPNVSSINRLEDLGHTLAPRL